MAGSWLVNSWRKREPTELQELTEAIAELKAGAEDVDAQDIVMGAAEDLLNMNRRFTRFEWVLVIVRRSEFSGEETWRRRYGKKTLEHALKGLADWRNHNQNLVDGGVTFSKNWTGHVEQREIIEFPWERLNEED